ncbi:MAG: hypothetical protein O6949_01185 [Chloroflexi bacterium]|nr:hypothetical protein [Chloroflexota bacterium]
MGFRAIHAVVLLAIILVSAWVRADEATWNVIPLELPERMA